MIISVTNYYVHCDRRDDLCTFSLIGLTLNQLHLYRLTDGICFQQSPLHCLFTGNTRKIINNLQVHELD